MKIDGIELDAGDRLLVRGIERSKMTLLQRLWWKLCHPFTRYPSLDPNGVYTVTIN